MKQKLKLIYIYFIKKSIFKILISVFLLYNFSYYFMYIMNIGKEDLFKDAILDDNYWFQMLINLIYLLISTVLVYDKKAKSLFDRHTQINKLLIVFILGFIIMINQRDQYLDDIKLKKDLNEIRNKLKQIENTFNN